MRITPPAVGTTGIIARLKPYIKRRSWISDHSDALNFSGRLEEPLEPVDIRLYQGDARHLDKIEGDSIDLIATHPPYANIIKYSGKGAPHNGDLSKVRSIAEFVDQIEAGGG